MLFRRLSAAPRASPHVQRTSPGMMSRAMPAKTMNHQAAAGDAHQKNEELTAQVRHSRDWYNTFGHNADIYHICYASAPRYLSFSKVSLFLGQVMFIKNADI